MDYIRAYRAGDLAELQRMHAQQGFDYTLPDLDNVAFVTKVVLEADGKVAMAILGHMTCEAYFLHDPDLGTPRDRWQRFLGLHEAAKADGWNRGFDDVHAFLPPGIAKSFGRRLVKLGWTPERWTPYWRPLP